MHDAKADDQDFHDATVEKYNQFVSQFNPIDFDANKWVLAAKNAGMKYIVVTAKHHDGFCMWDTDETDYDIVDRLEHDDAPFKHDVLAELKMAADRHGLKFGVYYSILDWHHEAFELNTDRDNLKNAIVFKKFKPGRKGEYISYMKAQFRELYNMFDPSIIWLDGAWFSGWTLEDGQEIFEHIKSLNPDIVVNDRAAPAPWFGESLEDKERALFERTLNNPHDYITFEQLNDVQFIDPFLEEFPNEGWELAMTLNNNWGYNARDTNWKSAEQILTDEEAGLINLSSKGGNLLLNVGPDAQGNIPLASLDRLAEIGDWFSVNGESIYGTSKVPDTLKQPDWGWFTYKPGVVYAHIIDWPQTSQLEVDLPDFGMLRSAYLLDKSGRIPLKTQRSISGFRVDLPGSSTNALSSVIVLDFSETTPTLIQSNFGDQGNFEELVVHEDGRLCHYWRDNDDEPDFPWHKTVCFGENITSDPTLIQSNFGDQGDFELVVNQGGRLCHYWRDNDDPNLTWSDEPFCFGENITSAPTLIQSNFGDQGNFELVVNQGGRLCHYWRDNDDPNLTWSDEPFCFGENITSAPTLIQSNFGDQGNFELVVNQGGRLCHYWRDNDDPNFTWSDEPFCFGKNITSDPTLIQSNFGDHGNFELVIQKEDQLCHWWRSNDDLDFPWKEGECFEINLVAHWPLAEGNGKTTTDISVNGHDGVLINGPVWNGNILSFDGVDDYVNVGLIDVSDEALTLAGWAQSDELENCGSRDCRILSKATGTATQDHYWMLSTIKVGNETRLRFRLKTNGSTSTLIASSGNLRNGELFHVAAVYDGATMRLYKDGIEVGSMAKTGGIDSNNVVETWVGGNPNNATSRPWKGLIADVRIYQKALTVEEVSAIKDNF